ncbi:signal peptidase I [Paenactinomyces guangxiensis]|uniref:Signal peptidase I n=1 Tax=Paenactinomyces guangxiensis TaxID=1490290 RepID=A0A7W1WRG4_9BACL|nr:signal peptidase I [Paenactinomyces guangxiensis]MBA4494710.1 signal peptidase I [Paenactinomyces guangxiensis]MBH8591794.1 signal peptidase I [Paenactinomyces guangxiensis]
MSTFAPRSERLRKQKKSLGKTKTWEWTQAFLLAVVLAILIRLFILEPFNVSGPSMKETMHSGDLVIVNKLIYKLRDPKPGEVIVFHAVEHKDYVKRVVALPGETVEAKNNKLMINGKIVNEPYISEHTRTQDFDMRKVPPGHVFVLGDNRTDSSDSREFGPVSMKKIIGRADLIYWPFQDFGFLW